jgi:hypothetical protein
MKSLVPREVIEQKILLLQGEKLILDKDLAALYGVTTINRNKAVKRNIERFPKSLKTFRRIRSIAPREFELLFDQ